MEEGTVGCKFSLDDIELRKQLTVVDEKRSKETKPRHFQYTILTKGVKKLLNLRKAWYKPVKAAVLEPGNCHSWGSLYLELRAGLYNHVDSGPCVEY